MREFLSPLRMRTAGLWIVPAETTTDCRARTSARRSSLSRMRAPMQWRLVAVGVYLSSVSGVGSAAVGDEANRRRSTVVLTRNLAPCSEASLSHVTVPPCFSP